MTAVREQIMAALAARLRLRLAGVTVEEMASGDPAAFPNINIVDRGQRLIEEMAQVSLYAANLLIEGYVQGDGGADSRARINALYRSVIVAIAEDESFGGLAQNFREGDLVIETAHFADVRSIGFVLEAEIQFFARRTDPALQ